MRIHEVNFYAHDNIGGKARGKINIDINGTRIAHEINILQDGSNHYIYANIYGDEVTFTQRRDDVYIGRVVVIYSY